MQDKRKKKDKYRHIDLDRQIRIDTQGDRQIDRCIEGQVCRKKKGERNPVTYRSEKDKNRNETERKSNKKTVKLFWPTCEILKTQLNYTKLEKK